MSRRELQASILKAQPALVVFAAAVSYLSKVLLAIIIAAAIYCGVIINFKRAGFAAAGNTLMVVRATCQTGLIAPSLARALSAYSKITSFFADLIR